MSYITQKMAKERLMMYLDAEEAVLTGQSYKIGSRELKRADLKEIREGIKLWENRLEKLEKGRRTSSRTVRMIPRDL